MKSLILSFIMMSFAFAETTLDDLVGVYDVHSTEIPIRTILTIEKDDENSYRGKIAFNTRRSPFGKLNCSGSSEINVEENVMQTESRCKSGLEFQHILELSGISNFDNFSTYVQNTLYGGVKILMHFKRIEKK